MGDSFQPRNPYNERLFPARLFFLSACLCKTHISTDTIYSWFAYHKNHTRQTEETHYFTFFAANRPSNTQGISGLILRLLILSQSNNKVPDIFVFLITPLPPPFQPLRPNCWSDAILITGASNWLILAQFQSLAHGRTWETRLERVTMEKNKTKQTIQKKHKNIKLKKKMIKKQPAPLKKATTKKTSCKPSMSYVVLRKIFLDPSGVLLFFMTWNFHPYPLWHFFRLCGPLWRFCS